MSFKLFLQLTGQTSDYMGIKMNKSTITLMMMTMLSGTAYAESTQLTPNFSPESVTVSTSAGLLSGKSHEQVYDTGTGRKIKPAGLEDQECGHSKRRHFLGCIFVSDTECRGWTSPGSGAGHMDDYDWMNDNQSGWTDHSSHPQHERQLCQ